MAKHRRVGPSILFGLFTLLSSVVPAHAQTGSISGRVTDASTGSPIPGVGVEVYTSGPVSLRASSETDGAGVFTVSRLEPGSYYVRTAVSSATRNYVDEAYDNVPCLPDAYCFHAATIVPVTAESASSGIDFALTPGGSVTGTIRDASTRAGLGSASVVLYHRTLYRSTRVTVSLTGSYAVPGLPTGTYDARASAPGYASQQYDHFPCDPFCPPGTPVVVVAGNVTSGIDFDLLRLGSIVGTVADVVTGLPIHGVGVSLTTAEGGFSGRTETTSSGAFRFTNLSPGRYHAYTTGARSLNYIDELYDDIPCFECGLSGVGHAINGRAITVAPGVETGVIDFALSPGGSIAGSVTDAVTGAAIPFKEIWISDAAGSRVGAPWGSGTFVVTGLRSGTYFALVRPESGDYSPQVFDHLPCQEEPSTGTPYQCPLGAGTPIHVTAGRATRGIDFALSPPGLMTGIVSDATTDAPLAGAYVGIYAGPGHALRPGTRVTSAFTNSAGVYSVSLATGKYYAAVTTQSEFVNEVWPDIACTVTCEAIVTSGTPILVSSGATTRGIDFALTPGGRVTGKVTAGDDGSGLAARLRFYDTAGRLVSWTTSVSGTGVFTASLPPGTYYARTEGLWCYDEPCWWPYVDVLYSGIACAVCDPVSGTPITVASGNTTSRIDFVLPRGGSVAGTVTDEATAAGLTATIRIYTARGDLYKTAFPAAGTGMFSAVGLATGTYYARTKLYGSPYVDELWDNIECVDEECPVSAGTPIVVTMGAVRGGIDFALTRGASLSGSVTNEIGEGIGLVGVSLFSQAGGRPVARVYTDSYGAYDFRGLPGGTYFLRTTVYTQFGPNPNYVDEAYGDILCVPCSVTESTPIVLADGEARTGVNLVLSPGGALSGFVTDAATEARAVTPGAAISVYTPSGDLATTVMADYWGKFRIAGLPPGTYYVSASAIADDGSYYVDKLYDDRPCLGCVQATETVPHVVLPCPTPCAPTVTTGTPVSVALDRTRLGVDFALSPGGGAIAGAVTEASTGAGLSDVQVLVYNGSNTLVKSAITDPSTGVYTVGGLAPGTYHARTVVSEATPHVVDEAFGGTPCAPCTVASASVSIVVTAGTVAENIDFQLMPAGSFAGTVTNAATLAAPVAVRGVMVQAFTATGEFVKGVFANGLGVYQLGGLPAGTYYARTAAGPSGPTYVDELYHNRSCTIGSCPVTSGTPITVSAGATTTGIDFSLDRNLISNGGFTSGLSPGWLEYATPDTSHIVSKVEQGIYQFYRVPTAAGTNQAVVFQPTGAAVGSFETLVAEFQLGNNSTARKRVTVLVHNSDFSDRSVCRFWLEPGSPLGTYGMLAHTNKAWSDATISFYAATPNSDGGYYQIDNVSLQRAPLEPVTWTTCIDPTAPAPGVIPPAVQLVDGLLRTNSPRPSLEPSATWPIREIPPAPFRAGVWMNDGVAPSANGAVWETLANATGGAALSWGNAIDLRDATTARLTFMSRLSAPRQAFVEVRVNGFEWLPVALVSTSPAWLSLDVDLTPYVGSLIEVRFVLVAQDRLEGSPAGVWSLEDLRVDVDSIH